MRGPLWRPEVGAPGSFHSCAVAFDSKPLKAHPSANFQRRPPGNKTAWARPGDPPAENLLLSLWVSICSRQLRPGSAPGGLPSCTDSYDSHWPRGLHVSWCHRVVGMSTMVTNHVHEALGGLGGAMCGGPPAPQANTPPPHPGPALQSSQIAFTVTTSADSTGVLSWTASQWPEQG